ncbi:uncharacterized protein LOC101154847 [Oryzias latipes]|uniref:uncharacterized protein LOC101154847 n=1 Tax=Oryzias latipes TaxID=8090 RepID=UPI0000E9D1FB|nr:uncharacterized protein LOC101154847 [Oryzias latipes]
MAGFCWTLLVLMLCRTSHASQDLDTKDVTLKRVFVLCPNFTTQHVLFKLTINQELMATCEIKNSSQIFESQPSNTDVEFKKTDALVGFELRGAMARADVAYRCDADKKFPPPFESFPNHSWFLVFHEETCTNPEACQEGGGGGGQLLWVWVTGVTLLATYGLAVTVAAFVLWFKLKDADSQNDYMNTKPKAARKRRGLQNPTPKYV